MAFPNENYFDNKKAISFVVGLFVVGMIVWSFVSHFTTSAINWVFQNPAQINASGGVMVGSTFDVAAHFLAMFITGVGAIAVSAWTGLFHVVASVVSFFMQRQSVNAKIESALKEYVTKSQVNETNAVLADRIRKLKTDTETSVAKIVESVAEMKDAAKPKTTTTRRRSTTK